ncbi:hypothetical protein TBLA_0A06110 [Henningerozyma blattae CBS 6284]|uniref:Thiamine phosphate synthase/TenI domain-containing protein n=1 Tax=Henningerozyma blattae (strain ATCC 34711 / CBS 6284 / DSM 70876 / NBRC 10599 / NRRL Y-10934 / UCD 77-7) TaxID=1071380 RepID=I2GWA2_HENB6|nr:hypothetical protein TBLA_0A06110 [Tetrapisispora blattae CBS 6284]CCH58404.1 hypothetical protein TBLA_0A06110 [Tetrapisispora blattae CBS 6284]
MVFPKDKVDYSLYLVTDSGMQPEGTTLYSQVEAGLQNGVTLVQIREKDCETIDFIKEGIAIRKLCTKYNVPLIINDRIDVALAIDADGVHVGQEDMPIPLVRKIVGPDRIIGWSVGKAEEVKQLAEWGPDYVDYIGVGTIFPTLTKKNPKKSPMGPQGAIKVLDALETYNATWCKTVAIGGLHPNNIPRVLYQCVSSNGKRALDGISLVSDIMASKNAAGSAKILRDLINGTSFKYVPNSLVSTKNLPTTNDMADIIKTVSKNRPLVQHITNKVHYNFGANVTLALNSSPIMSEIESEVGELSLIPYATLLLNTGTIAPIDTVKSALRAYNDAKRPIVFDPVGYSSTTTRLVLNDTCLSFGQYACVKGNSSEILSLANLSTEKMKGVDASSDNMDLSLLIKATKAVAFQFKTVVVCTGETDVIADGTNSGDYQLSKGTGNIPDDLMCVTVNGGPIPIMGDITASGCSLGSTIASLVGGSDTHSLFYSVITAVALYKAAGKLASTRCKGSGSFHVELIDALYELSHNVDPTKWDVKISASK